MWLVEFYKLLSLVCQTTCFFEEWLGHFKDSRKIRILDILIAHPVHFLPVIFDKLKGIRITFRQLLTSFRIDDKCHVTKLRCFPSKRFIDHELFWGVGNVVISTDDVRDLHIVVIDDNGKVVSWIAIFLLDDPIPTDIATFKLDIAFDHIMPLVDTRLIHCQTNRWNDACCFTFCDISSFFFFAHAEIFVDIARCFTRCFLAFTFSR